MKTKTFTFEVWNNSKNNFYKKDYGKSDWFKVLEERLSSDEQIDEVINEFIADKEVVSINITHYTSDRHNNGGDDTIKRVYTIIYK